MATHVEDESLSEIGRAIVDDTQRMVELEIALVRAEAVRTLVRARDGLLLASAGISLLFLGFMFWLLALAFALGLLQHPIGYFLVGSVIVVLAALAGFFGFRLIRKGLNASERTVKEIIGDVEWARELPSRRANSSS
jgi:hypothetical protein